MSRRRPYIPLSVCVQVAERQVQVASPGFWRLYEATISQNAMLNTPLSMGHRLRLLLGDLFPEGKYQLDHDPALILRKFRNDARLKPAARYTPNANDPVHLIYRDTADHLQKTTGRKPGAAKTITTKGSDIGIKTKFAKLARRGKKPKSRIPSRPFQKGRKFR